MSENLKDLIDKAEEDEKTRAQLESIRTYLNLNHHHHFSENIRRLLNPFLL